MKEFIYLMAIVIVTLFLIILVGDFIHPIVHPGHKGLIFFLERRTEP